MDYQTLTETDKAAISLIAQDEQSGRHLLRTDKDWNALPNGINKEIYKEVSKELGRALNVIDNTFIWISQGIKVPKLSMHDVELAICYRCCTDYEFNQLMEGELADLDISIASSMTKEQIIDNLSRYISKSSLKLLY